MYSMCCGIIVSSKVYHMDCLIDEELYKIFSECKYTQFSRSETYVSKIYPPSNEEYTCAKCNRRIE